jgi:serine/threonine-protein kinase RsbW
MPLGIDLELVLPRDNATVPLVRHILRHTLTEFGVTAACVGDVELAVTEAAANVIEHSDGDEQYEITVSVDEQRCRIRILDGASDFDGTGGPTEFPTGMAEQGRGMPLMKALMDSTRFETVPDQGTVLQLVKALEFETAPLQPATPVPPHGG